MFGWIKEHWKTIAVVAASTVVFVGVTVLTGGLGAPALVALAAGGFASGVTGSALSSYLDHKPISVKDALVQGAVASVLTVATAGIGRVVAPYVSRAVAPALTRVLPRAAVPFITNTVTNSSVGATLGAGTQVAQNAVMGRPLSENVGQATVVGGVTGAVLEPLARVLPKPTPPSGRLVHLTSANGEAGIRATGQVKGSRGIFAVPESAASQPTAIKVLRTGVEPSKTTNTVPLPESANVHFQEVTPIGPYSLIKRLGGVRYAPAGSIDVATGAFRSNGSAIGPRVLIYGPDALVYAAGATVFASVKAVESTQSPPAPPPQTARSKGMTKALGEIGQ